MPVELNSISPDRKSYQSVHDVIVLGSGAAGLSAALAASAMGLNVLIVEKTGKIGGSAAMSGGGVWIPANHLAEMAGIEDSVDDAITYLRAACPQDWVADDEKRWESFARNAPRMLQFLERHSPLRFELSATPDPQAEKPGGKKTGRMVSAKPLSRRLLGRYARYLRRSTLNHLFSYRDMYEFDIFSHTYSSTFRLLPRLIWRLATGTRGQGNALVIGLTRGCLDQGCRLELEARASDLILEDGRVVGVWIEKGGTRKACRAVHGVVVATGGFEWDSDMLKKYFPGPHGFNATPPTNTGDGQKMAARVGAALDRMDQGVIYPLAPTTYEGRRVGIPLPYHLFPAAIIVDREAQRFGSEYDLNFAEEFDRRDPVTNSPIHAPCWLIADATFLKHSPIFRWYARKEKGWLRKAPNLAELAGQIGLSPKALELTVARYNGFANANRDGDFRRGETEWERFKSGNVAGGANRALAPILKPPFVAVPMNRSLSGTKGGARTNEYGQVLRPDLSIIEGLYCAGNAMANPFGTRAVGSGTTLGPCLTWGHICGTTIGHRVNRSAETEL